MIRNDELTLAAVDRPIHKGGNDGWTLAFRGDIDRLEAMAPFMLPTPQLQAHRHPLQTLDLSPAEAASAASAGEVAHDAGVATQAAMVGEASAGQAVSAAMRGALERVAVPLRHAEMNWGNAYASVGAALPEVARRSCPVHQRERGFCGPEGGGEGGTTDGGEGGASVGSVGSVGNGGSGGSGGSGGKAVAEKELPWTQIGGAEGT